MIYSRPAVYSLLWLAVWMSTAAWAQTDGQGRAFAWQLWEAHQQSQQSGDDRAFQALLTSNPQMAKRAFVSTVEYATEIFQADPGSAREAMTFAAQLADLIEQSLGDGQPNALIQRVMQNDQTALIDFARYAIELFPGYAAALGQPQSPPHHSPPAGLDNDPEPVDGQDPYARPGGSSHSNDSYPPGRPGTAPYDPPSGPLRPDNATGGPPPNP